MSHQRRDRDVIRDAKAFNETFAGLRSFLYRNGIRNVRTSPKAKAAIPRAATELSNQSATPRGRG